MNEVASNTMGVPLLVVTFSVGLWNENHSADPKHPVDHGVFHKIGELVYFDFNKPPEPPDNGGGLFASVWIVSVIVFQVLPHVFGWTNFLFWEVDGFSSWVIIGFGLATSLTLFIVGVIEVLEKRTDCKRKK